MVVNLEKCHFMTLGFQDRNVEFNYENVVIKNSAEVKTLGITVSNKLKF